MATRYFWVESILKDLYELDMDYNNDLLEELVDGEEDAC